MTFASAAVTAAVMLFSMCVAIGLFLRVTEDFNTALLVTVLYVEFIRFLREDGR